MGYFKIKKRDNPEQRTQLQIIHYLKMIGATVGKTKVCGIANKFGQRFKDPYIFLGFPDLTCFFNNKIYFIEVKSEQGVQSPHQINFQSLCQQSNLPYILARSVEDVSEIIR